MIEECPTCGGPTRNEMIRLLKLCHNLLQRAEDNHLKLDILYVISKFEDGAK
jgi:hypothetical protein